MILESDIISKKICGKCSRNMLRIHEIIQAAIRQDELLKDKCQQYLGDKGIRLPNTCVTIKRDNYQPLEQKEAPNVEPCVSVHERTRDQILSPSALVKPRPSKNIKGVKGIHPSVIDIYRKYPRFKLPKRCIERHLAPIVSLAMNEVETYCRRQKLNMNKHTNGVNVARQPVNRVAKKKTSVPAKNILCSLNIRKSLQDCNKLPSSSKARIEEIILIEDIDTQKDHVSISPNRRQAHPDDDPVIFENITNKTQPRAFLNKSESQNTANTFLLSEKNELKKGDLDCTRPSQERVATDVEEDSDSNRLAPPVIASSAICNPSGTRSGHSDTTRLETKKSFKRKSLTSTAIDRNRKAIKSKTIFAKKADQSSSAKDVSTPTSDSSNLLTDSYKDTILLTESRDSLPETTACAEECLLPNTSKPEFIQSLGLTPAVAGLPQKNILICKICGNKQQNVAALKKHNSRHRVCPFCKLKFKSVERKQHHMEGDCEIKKIVESPGTYVSLKKVESNREMREKYKDALSLFGLIPESRHVSNGNLMDPDDVIVLSDCEESQLSATENAPEVSTGISKPEEVNSDSVGIVKPIVGIHNNTTLNQIENTLSDKRLIKELICVLKRMEHTTIEQEVQTVRPCNPDLAINKNDTCRLKNFKDHLWNYLVPVRINNGDFSVSYTTSTESGKSAELTDWNDIPVVEKRTRNTSQEISLMNTTYPLTFVTSQVQSSQLSLSSIQLMTAAPTMSFFLPNTSAFIPGAGLSIQPSINSTVNQTQSINNPFFSPITSTSLQTTPLLQNYTLSMTPLPIINNQVPVQTTPSVNVAATSTDTGSEPVVTSSTGNDLVSSTTTTVSSTNASSSASLSRSRKVCVSPRRSLSASTRSATKIKISSKKRFIKVKMGKLGTSPSSKASKLRVKNIWEMK